MKTEEMAVTILLIESKTPTRSCERLASTLRLSLRAQYFEKVKNVQLVCVCTRTWPTSCPHPAIFRKVKRGPAVRVGNPVPLIPNTT